MIRRLMSFSFANGLVVGLAINGIVSEFFRSSPSWGAIVVGCVLAIAFGKLQRVERRRAEADATRRGWL